MIIIMCELLSLILLVTTSQSHGRDTIGETADETDIYYIYRHVIIVNNKRIERHVQN
jgi:hypothetical protein